MTGDWKMANENQGAAKEPRPATVSVTQDYVSVSSLGFVISTGSFGKRTLCTNRLSSHRR